MAQAQFAGVNGAAAQQLVSNGERVDPGGFKLKFCTVCASNQNRFVKNDEQPSTCAWNAELLQIHGVTSSTGCC